MKETCNVINKSTGRVVYNIKEDGIRRVFFPQETKKDVSVQELTKLVQQPGGLTLLYDYLLVDDPDVLRYLINGEEAPEYWLTEEKIPSWMTTCTLDEFKDALDFAPEGTKDLIKQYAVSIPLNDYSKRQAIKEQLGFDVTLAIENSGEEEASANAGKVAQRRTTSSIAAPTSEAPQRRVTVKTGA